MLEEGNSRAGADGGIAEGPAGDDGAADDHATSERTSSLLMRHVLPPPSSSLSLEEARPSSLNPLSWRPGEAPGASAGHDPQE